MSVTCFIKAARRRVRDWLRDSVLACAADGYQEFSREPRL